MHVPIHNFNPHYFVQTIGSSGGPCFFLAPSLPSSMLV